MKKLLLMTSFALLTSCTIIMPPVDPSAPVDNQSAASTQAVRQKAQKKQAVSNSNAQKPTATAITKTATPEIREAKEKTSRPLLENCKKTKKHKVKKPDTAASNTATIAAAAGNTGQQQSAEARNKIKAAKTEDDDKNKDKKKKKRKPCIESTDVERADIESTEEELKAEN